MPSEAVEFLKIFIPALVAVGVWYLNESRKREWQGYERKENRYVELIRAFEGFYVRSEEQSLKNEFIRQKNLCWLYCPDEVIRAADAFLYTVKVGVNSSKETKERVAGEFFLALRRDLLSRKLVKKTSLTSADYRHLAAT